MAKLTLMIVALAGMCSCAPASFFSAISASSAVSAYSDCADGLTDSAIDEIIEKLEDRLREDINGLSPDEKKRFLDALMSRDSRKRTARVHEKIVRDPLKILDREPHKILGVDHHGV